MLSSPAGICLQRCTNGGDERIERKEKNIVFGFNSRFFLSNRPTAAATVAHADSGWALRCQGEEIWRQLNENFFARHDTGGQQTSLPQRNRPFRDARWRLQYPRLVARGRHF